MDYTQVKYFLEVAESQHITKSAEKLHIAQPALTKAIHKMEEELGVPLFLPRGRNIELSEYGRYLRDRLRPIQAELDSLSLDLRQMTVNENKTIRLNVLAASTLVTEAVIEYKKKHQDILFEIIQNSEKDLWDICITTKLFYQGAENHTDECVFTEKIFLAVPSSHNLGEKRSISLRDAASEGFISLMGPRQFRAICDNFCRHGGFSPNIIFESDTPATVQNMIAAGMGVGFWPEFTWGPLVSKNIKLLEIKDPPCQRDIVLRCRQNKADASAVMDFFLFLRQYIARSIQEC